MNINKKNKITTFLTYVVMFSIFLLFAVGFYITVPHFFDSRVDFMVAVENTFFIMIIPSLFLIYFIFRTKGNKRIHKTLFFLFITFFLFFILFAFNNFSLSLKEFKDKIGLLVKHQRVMNESEYKFYKKSGRSMNEEEHSFYKENGFLPIEVW